MITKLLIANRGEIACRIIRTARAMGIGTVAVYSDADAGAAHVAMADEAVHIGGSSPAESYLQGARIIKAAQDRGATAIHPGYGFLSENPDFVEAVEAAGLIFVGPSAKAIRAMGLKDAAKRLMQQAGVPVVPGYHGDNQDPAFLAQQADLIGYPILIKAVAGGGGKGMRKVTSPEDFAQSLESAQGEARTAFGNPAVLIEKYVEKPRHIEVQVFGDGLHAVHLFERDCSLQRRHQKVIEEAPAPGMTPEMRAVMGAAATRAAEAIGYKGAGTIEFIADASQGLREDGFWFMEMNTRLQVEHPVTEAITGLDLVEWQLRVAAGAPLPLSQDQITITGHAFEARLYAEDVPAGFLPATGRLEYLSFPTGVRADSGVRSGDAISPWYDPMIAKIITHGPTREIALQKLSQALGQTEVAGSVTNLDFLGALTRHKGFAAGDVDTGLIERDLPVLLADSPDRLTRDLAAILSAAGLWQGAKPDSGFTLWQPLPRSITLSLADTEITATLLQKTPCQVEITLAGIPHSLQFQQERWWLQGHPLQAKAITIGDRIHVFAQGCSSYTRFDPLSRQSSAGAASNITLSPMPGLVKAVFVQVGEAVQIGDRLAILEAMKMEHVLTATREGTVAEVLVAAGTQVEAGAAMVILDEAA